MLEVITQTLEQGTVAGLPGPAHRVIEHVVAASLCHCQMKSFVTMPRRPTRSSLIAHLFQGCINGLQINTSCASGRHGRNLHLEHLPCAQYFQWPPFLRAVGLREHGRVVVSKRQAAGTRPAGHIDARARADLDQPLHLEGNQGFAKRWPAHPELLRKLPLRRQSAARSVVASINRGAYTLRDLPVQALRFNSLKHG